MQDHPLSIMEIVSFRKPSIEEHRDAWLAHKQDSKRAARALLAGTGALACIMCLMYLHLYEVRWQRAAAALAITFGGFLLRGVVASRHREEDFLDGYDEGVRAGVNRILEITQEDEALISEVLRDAEGVLVLYRPLLRMRASNSRV